MRHSLAQNVCVLVCKLFECLHALAWTVRTGESSWCKLQVKQLCKGVRNSCTSEAVKWSLLCCGTICFVKGTSCKRIQEEAQEAVEDGFHHPAAKSAALGELEMITTLPSQARHQSKMHPS